MEEAVDLSYDRLLMNGFTVRINLITTEPGYNDTGLCDISSTSQVYCDTNSSLLTVILQSPFTTEFVYM